MATNWIVYKVDGSGVTLYLVGAQHGYAEWGQYQDAMYYYGSRACDLAERFNGDVMPA